MNKWLFLAFLALYLLTASFRIDSGDGEAMYQVTDSLLNGRGFAISDTQPDQDFLGAHGERIPREAMGGSGSGWFGVDGRYYAKAGPAQSFAAVPFYLLGKLAHVMFSVWSVGFWTRISVTLLNPIVAAFTVVLVAMTTRLFFDQPTALTLAVLFGLGTPVWPYGKSFFSEPLLGVMMLLGGYAAMRARCELHIGWYALSGAALGAAVLVKPMGLLAVPVVGLYLLLACRPNLRQWTAWLVPLGIEGFLLGWYNWVRFGNPLMTGRGWEISWDTPPWFGAYGLLFSSGKGLLWFAPIIVLGIAALPSFIRRARAEGLLMIGVPALFIGAHAVFNYWSGGGSWGPRLIIPAVVWLVLPMGILLERKVHPVWQELMMAVVIAASIIVQVLGVSVGYARHLQAVYNTSRTSEEYFDRVQFNWADSPIVGQARELMVVTGNVRSANAQQELRALVKRTLTAPRNADLFYDARSEAVGYLAFNLPDLWFVYGWMMGAPLWAMAVIAAALAAGLAIAIRRLHEYLDGSI